MNVLEFYRSCTCEKSPSNTKSLKQHNFKVVTINPVTLHYFWKAWTIREPEFRVQTSYLNAKSTEVVTH